MRAMGIGIVLLALVIGILPAFTDCQSQGRAIEIGNGRTIPMKCHWTAMAAVAMAVPLLGVGGLMAARPRADHKSLSAIGALLGIGVVLLPTALIGVCASSDMICNMIMKPALILSGSLVTVLSLATFALGARQARMAGQPA